MKYRVGSKWYDRHDRAAAMRAAFMQMRPLQVHAVGGQGFAYRPRLVEVIRAHQQATHRA